MIINSVNNVSFGRFFSKNKTEKKTQNTQKENKLRAFLNNQAILNRSKVKPNTDIIPLILSDVEKDIILNSSSRHKFTFYPNKLICEIDRKKQDETFGEILELGGFEEKCSKKKSAEYIQNYTYEGNLEAVRISGVQKDGEYTQEVLVCDNSAQCCIEHSASRFKEEINEFRTSNQLDFRKIFSKTLSNYDTLDSISLYIND